MTAPNINQGFDLETARHLKYQAGIEQHRGGDTSQEFNGELCNEFWLECLDQLNYLAEMEKKYGYNLSLRKSLVIGLALDIERIHAKHLAEGI